MWRALFLAIGIYMCLLGAQCLVVEKAVLTVRREAPLPGMTAGRSREFAPPEWAPWSLISAGAVTILYSFTIPRRVGGGTG
jgi:hypothetical protein